MGSYEDKPNSTVFFLPQKVSAHSFESTVQTIQAVDFFSAYLTLCAQSCIHHQNQKWQELPIITKALNV